MVVPMERVSRSDKLKKFVGNNLILNMANNKVALAVTGNNCKIKIEDNSGAIRVVGDHCDVTVLKGSANIDYVGNSGRIHLGEDVSDNTVSYVGNEGEISSLGKSSGPTTDKPAKTTNIRGGIGSTETLNITNSNSIRIVNACIPNIDISFPTVRVSRKGQRLRRNN